MGLYLEVGFSREPDRRALESVLAGRNFVFTGERIERGALRMRYASERYPSVALAYGPSHSDWREPNGAVSTVLDIYVDDNPIRDEEGAMESLAITVAEELDGILLEREMRRAVPRPR